VVFSQRALLMESFFSSSSFSVREKERIVDDAHWNCPLVLGGGGVVFSQRALLVESSFSVEIERGSLMTLIGIVHLPSGEGESSFLKECYWWNPSSLLRGDR